MMANNKKRPVYLNLFQIRLPVTGVVSILHRVSGVLLVLAIPFLLYGLQRSLTDPGAFDALRSAASAPIGCALAFGLLWLLAQHFWSGMRHLLLDLDVGIDRAAARRGSWLVFVAAIATVLIVWVRA
jgi:succinate dehydrogenase / fumarate reductase cytochrome b subunit